MKKVLFLLLIILSGCNKCMIAQIPPQRIMVGESCSAILPDYLTRVTATDNCVLASLVQIPEAGTILTEPINNIRIRATDNFNNFTEINFDVILIDTIPPVITADNTLLTTDYDLINSLYNQADRIIAEKLDEFDETFPYAEIGLPVLDSSYYKKYLVVISSPGHAITGEGGRIWQWEAYNVNDSIK